MSGVILEQGSYKNISATASITTKPGSLLGIFVASASATPTILVADTAAAASSPLIVNTFTPIGGTWYPMPFSYVTGLRIVIGGTVDCTVCFVPSTTA